MRSSRSEIPVQVARLAVYSFPRRARSMPHNSVIRLFAPPGRRKDVIKRFRAPSCERPPFTSILRVARRPRERDNVADIGHAGGVDDGALEPQAEARVGHGAESAEVAIPVIMLLLEADLGEAGVEDIQ